MRNAGERSLRKFTSEYTSCAQVLMGICPASLRRPNMHSPQDEYVSFAHQYSDEREHQGTMYMRRHQRECMHIYDESHQ